MKFTLFALALASFAIGTTEFAPMGLLPVIAHGVGVTIPSAGMLISAYAVGVMIGAPIMTLLLSRWPRKTALLSLMVIFIVGNGLSAIAPGYTTLMISRIVTSLAHGAFFGIGSVVAASLVAREKRASAVAAMFSGLTIANIGGVPAATWLGHAVGWRAAFAGTAVLGGLAVAMLAYALPAGAAGQMPEVRRELKVLMRPAVLRALLTTVLGAGAMFTLYTYIAAALANLSHASAGFVTAMLIVIGIGFTIGNAISGKLANKSLEGTLLGFFAMLAAVMFVFPMVASSHVGAAIALLLWGVATFAVVPPLQMRVMEAAHDAPGLASSVNIGAFNLGNALGAAAGGGVLSAGWGYAWIAPVGGLLAVVGLCVVLFSRAQKVVATT